MASNSCREASREEVVDGGDRNPTGAGSEV